MRLPLLPAWRQVLHPAGYHGHRVKPPFFEGWYFKLVDAAGVERLALIPGVSIPGDAGDAHAFLQVLDGARHTAAYLRYPLDAFSGDRDRVDLRLGASRFTAEGITLAVARPELRLEGEVRFRDPVPWPVRPWAPGIMGWYAWVPAMECYHGVPSLDHRLEGRLTLDGRALGLDGGRGYLEKDWGRTFPAAWVWLQTNRFEGAEGVSLTASIARIPWLGASFPGFIVGLLVDGRLHRFATYTGARTEVLEVGGTDRVRWVMRGDGLRLTLEAEQGPPLTIVGPSPTGMVRQVGESLSGTVRVTLADARTGAVRFEGTGTAAGMEIHGDVRALAPKTR